MPLVYWTATAHLALPAAEYASPNSCAADGTCNPLSDAVPGNGVRARGSYDPVPASRGRRFGSDVSASLPILILGAGGGTPHPHLDRPPTSRAGFCQGPARTQAIKNSASWYRRSPSPEFSGGWRRRGSAAGRFG